MTMSGSYLWFMTAPSNPQRMVPADRSSVELHEPDERLAFACLRFFQDAELMGGQMPLDDQLYKTAEHVRFYRVQFNGHVAELLCSRVGSLGRPGGQIPVSYLFRSDSDALEVDFRVRRHLLQRLLDLLAGIDAGGIEVTEVIDVGRHIQRVDVLGRTVQEGKARVAAR